jgi:hypothetical protein
MTLHQIDMAPMPSKSPRPVRQQAASRRSSAGTSLRFSLVTLALIAAFCCSAASAQKTSFVHDGGNSSSVHFPMPEYPSFPALPPLRTQSYCLLYLSVPLLNQEVEKSLTSTLNEAIRILEEASEIQMTKPKATTETCKNQSLSFIHYSHFP